MLAITPGDPRGVGPELVCRVLAERAASGSPLSARVYGDRAAMERAARLVGGGLDGVEVRDPGDHGEPVEVAAIRAAVADVRAGRCAALVTGPIHKARLAARGFHHAGHTEFLAELCGVSRPVMAFVGGSVRVALVTVHLPLRAVPDALTTELVLHTVRTSDAALRERLGLPRPRVAVCGLNPHAGDEGLLGSEDGEVVAPAVAAAVAEGLDAHGPISAEHAFVAARRGEFDLVVAMYHDQGLAPLKALDFGRCVNWTLGLPIVRTSVDHGTALDLAWRGVADPGSLRAAVELAERLTARPAVSGPDDAAGPGRAGRAAG